MRIVYAPRALRDIDDILAYTHKRSPRGARALSLAIEAAIHACALNPKIAAPVDEPGVYRWPLRRYRYTIFVRALADEAGIEVVRVVHAARVKNLRKVPSA